MASQGDVSPYRHTEECNQLVREFKECHKNNPYLKFTGVCNEIKFAMDKCLKAELEANRAKNRTKRREKHRNSDVHDLAK